MTVWDKIAARAYDNKDPCPVHPLRPRLGSNPSAGEAQSYADALTHYEKVALPEHEAAYKLYISQCADLAAPFQDDLEEYYGMKGHPKAQMLYWKSYERGHHAGFSEIASAYSDYVELVK
jgi:hypothetical protein